MDDAFTMRGVILKSNVENDEVIVILEYHIKVKEFINLNVKVYLYFCSYIRHKYFRRIKFNLIANEDRCG
ncbi:hypothetical protein KYB31_10480 [Clostridium felsineum]|uniref:hypothetical protein n=1 Tax=Clostridium felsineum TaxID=36839 RepID=UPI00214DA861|nr:hypothetical protein [Clostridium felsineum]MCR3759410.1 hypothetical protein [Clostridium felsineum]